MGKLCSGLLVRQRVACDLSEISPLPAPLVFVANVSENCFRRSLEKEFRKSAKAAGTKCGGSLAELRMFQCDVQVLDSSKWKPLRRVSSISFKYNSAVVDIPNRSGSM